MTNTPRIIEVIVSPAGETRIQTRGFAGSTCKDATRQLEQALGLVESDRATGEMHQHLTDHSQEQQRAG